MQRKSLFWFAVALLCLGGAIYFWGLGDRWEAERKASQHSEVAVPVKALGTNGLHAFAAGVTNRIVPNIAVNGSRKGRKADPFEYRLTNTTESVEKLVHNERGILLANALFDTSRPRDLSGIPERLRAGANGGTYIVQANGALGDGFRGALQEAGAKIVSYIPNNAYLVRVSDAGAAQLSANPLTQSVLAYEPYYKLDGGLLKLAMEDATQIPQNGVRVTVFPDAYDATKASLEQMGAIIVGEDQSPFGPVLAVEPAQGTLSAVASLSGVQLVTGLHRRVHANDLLRTTVGAAADSLTTANYMGLSGSNVLININDDGVDQNHPDLAGRLIFDASGNPTDTSGHGTHVAGTIMGSGLESTTVSPVPPGSATNGNSSSAGPFVFRGVANNANAFVMSLFEPDSYLQETAGRKNVFISNNSWNYTGDASYDIAAASYDAAVRDSVPEETGSQPILYVFAAGNNGGAADNGTAGDADSILSPATAKNVITVGAVEQFRNITNGFSIDGVTNFPFSADTDSGDQVASFSSRGNVGVSIEGGTGRFKPDLIAPGTYVISDRSTEWDTQAYYNPTNDTVSVFPNRNVTTNVLNFLPPLFIEDNDVQIEIIVTTNRFSPKPFPAMPIYAVVNDSNVNPTTNNFVGTNDVLFPTNGVTLTPFDSLRIAIGDPTNVPINFDVVIHVFSTNDTGFYIALSNLNNTLETNGPPFYYRYESGTSMAAAGVSGMLACLQEFFNGHPFLTYSPALMKALLINGANTLDDYNLQVNTSLNSQGWGVPSMTNSLPLALANITAANRNTMPVLFVDQSLTNVLATGQSNSYSVVLTPDGQSQDLRITLVWTDPPGNPVAGTKLVNDLDLIVSNNVTGDVFFGNDIPAGSDYNELADTNNPIVDSVNNVENVFIQAPVDTNFTITVLARRVNVNAITANTNGIVQDYALVISSVAGIGQPPVASPFTNFTTVQTAVPVIAPVTNVIAVSNGVPLFNQRVGANSQFSGTTNGTLAQWNFYVYTNTAITDPTLPNAASFKNIAFVTFAPPGLGVPRMEASGEIVSPDTAVTRFAGADVDMYVSTNSALTNLDPAVLATALVSATRTGTEKVLITDAPSLVYYIAIKSEDQQGAQYDFLGVAVNQPFDQTDDQGNVLVTMLTSFPVPIPTGGPSNPNHALILGVTTAQSTIRKVVVTNVVAHQEFGDLIGTLTHETGKPETAVLNNHSFFTDLNNLTNVFVYDDTGDGEIPGARTSDGPGTLRNFVGDQASDGIWRFVMVNDSSLTDTGAVVNFVIKLEPQPPGNSFNVLIQPHSFYFNFVDVPADATNLSIGVAPQGTTDSLDLYVREGDFPSQSIFDFFMIINPPGGTLNINKFSSPPLNADRYFYGVYNPNAVAIQATIMIGLGISLNPKGPGVFTSIGNEPILDDAVTYSTNFVNADSLVVSTEVGVRIQHPRESDLVLTLISPSGTRVLLAENRGGFDTNGYGGGLNTTNVLPVTDSGNNSASTNLIALTNNAGTLLIDYDFHTLADDLRVYYDGSRIYDSGLIAGSGTISVDFGPGNATNIEILMNEPGTNPSTNGDLWDYTASVITKNVAYAVFSEDTNLAMVPIKFAVPPFGGGAPLIGGSSVVKSGFEVPAGVYPVNSTPDGWTVIPVTNAIASTNQTQVVYVPQFADSGSNVLALHDFGITRTFPTVAGRSYTLTFANHGRPSLTPTAWYKGEGNGEDSTAHGNDGMLENGATTAPGLVGQAFNLNGNNQYLLVPDAQYLHFSNSMSEEFWINPSDVGAFHSIFTKVDAVAINQFSYGMGLIPGGAAVFQLDPTGREDASSGSAFAQTTNTIPVGQWTYLAGTYDGSNINVYVNGILQGSVPYSAGIFPGSDNLAVGANAGGEDPALDVPGGLPSPFAGLIDEATLYGNALTIVQLQDIYAAGSAGKCPESGSCTVSATITLAGDASTINGIDRWTENSFTFVAPTNSVVVTIVPNTNFDGTVQDGMLLDSFNLVENPLPNPTNYFLPEESLDKLKGERAQGDWRLEVLDNRAGATNPQPSILSWQLSLQLSDTIPPSIPLLHAIPQTNNVAANSIVYYSVDVPLWAKFATNTLLTSGTVDLLFGEFAPPTGTNPAIEATLFSTPPSSNSVTLNTNPGLPDIVPGQRYYLGVRNNTGSVASFVIEVDFDITSLTNRVPVTNSIAPSDVPKYYQFDILSNSIAASFQILNSTGPLEMVVKKGPPLPDVATFDYVQSGAAPLTQVVTTNTQPMPIAPGRWYIGVFNIGAGAANYTIEASQSGPPTIIMLANDQRFTNSAPPGPDLTVFYQFSITNTNSAALFELLSLSGNVDLTLQREALPYTPPFFDSSANLGTSNEQIVIRTNVLGTNINGNWFLGVPNDTAGNVTYTIHAVVSTNGLLPSQVPIVPVITVPPPTSPDGPTLTFPSVKGETYWIQEAPSPLGPWTTIAIVVAPGDVTTFTAPPPGGGGGFYRVVQVPSP